MLVLLLLAGGGTVGAFVWPGFLKDKVALPGFLSFLNSKGKPGIRPPTTRAGANPNPQVGAVDPEAENQAAQAMEKLGATVTRDDKAPGKPVIGVEFTNYSGTPFKDGDLKQLAPFKNLQSLGLLATDVTDAGLKELTGFGQLSYLDLRGTGVTPAGLKQLAGLPKLDWVSLHNDQWKGDGLKELAGLPHLRPEPAGAGTV